MEILEMTDLEGLENLKIPTDLTEEQIFELYTLAGNLTYVVYKKRSQDVIQKHQDKLTAWFMYQNFHHQIKQNT